MSRKKIPNNLLDDGNIADDAVETMAGFLKDGQVQLKGNPMKSIRHIRCPSCRLRRLLYPRDGLNSRPVPYAAERYCKTEPIIILYNQDNGREESRVKPNARTRKRHDKQFEYKEIVYAAVKCPNRRSLLGDHWKAVKTIAAHPNGRCYLNKDHPDSEDSLAYAPLHSQTSNLGTRGCPLGQCGPTIRLTISLRSSCFSLE